MPANRPPPAAIQQRRAALDPPDAHFKPPNRPFIASRWRPRRCLSIVHSSQSTSTHNRHQEHIMNIAKNMEAIFLTAVVLCGAMSFASAAIPAHLDARAHHTSVVDAGRMQVVTVSAHRLSAAQKASLAD